MRYLMTYENFNNSDLYTNEFKNIISKVNSPISKTILNFNKEIDISQINPMSDNAEMVSYIRNGKKEMMKIGRLASRILSEVGETVPPTVIEKFSNEYKGVYSSLKVFQNFEIVFGENIRKYYLMKNYHPKK